MAATTSADRTERAPGTGGSTKAWRPGPGLVVTVLCLSGTVVALQQTLVLPLIPELPALLHVSTDSASWLVTATLLAGAVATPTIARLADMYGKRRMMVVALSTAIVGSVVGASSTALPVLIGARALQGVGMALIPVGIAMMRDELPRERLPLGVALMSATLAIGAGAALPLAGLITEHLGWHAIFWLTGGFGVVMLAAVLVVLPESPVRTHGTFDVRGAVLLSIALTAALLALSKGTQWGWTSPVTLGLAVGGVLLLAVWAPLELRTPGPLVDLRVAARPAVLLVNAAAVLVGFDLFANMVVTTLVLQMPTATGYGLGFGLLDTGLWMIPIMVAFGVMAPVSAWLTRRFSPQATMLSGGLIMGVTYAARVFGSDGIAQVVAGSVAVGVGTAMTYSAMPTLIMRAVPVTETASANGLNVLLRSLGTSTASAAAAAITTASAISVAGQELPSFHGLATMFWIAAAAGFGVVLLAVRMLRMEDYASEPGRSGAELAGVGAWVVRGQVVSPSGRPVDGAVVTLLTPGGDPVDWGQADSDGRFTAAVPEAGDYLVVTSADGWQPRARIVDLVGSSELPSIVLRDRLTLSGRITDAEGQPLDHALVVLTRHTGESVASTRTRHDGRYEVARPNNGRYVLTVVAQDHAIGARPVTILDAGRDIDLCLGTSLA